MMIPMNSDTAMTPSSSSVDAALRDFGFRKAGTPLLMASTPVSAAQPDENALATRKTIAKPITSPCSDCIWKPADSARSGTPRMLIWNNPQPSMTYTPIMKA